MEFIGVWRFFQLLEQRRFNLRKFVEVFEQFDVKSQWNLIINFKTLINLN